MDIGELDVRRKPVPEGQYHGTIMDLKWKDVLNDDGSTTKKGRLRIKINTDNAEHDESTKGKSVFDNLPWTEDMAWKFGAIYAAANGLFEDDDELIGMTREKFENGTKNKDVVFDVKHNHIPDKQTGKERLMVNVQNYKTPKEGDPTAVAE